MKLELLLLSICISTASAQAQQLLRTVSGGVGDQFGTAMIQAGDQNGDGFQDVLVGAPGAPSFNASGGAIFCISGAYLATGTGLTILWSLTSATPFQNEAFGTSLANVGDLTGDSVPDFAVGAPNYSTVNSGPPHREGIVYLIDGSTHQRIGFATGVFGTLLGHAMANIGDIDNDGMDDLAVSGLSSTTTTSYVFVVHASTLLAGGSLNNMSNVLASGQFGFGTSIASGFDMNSDGHFDVLIGSPLQDTVAGGHDAGMVFVWNPLATQAFLFLYFSNVAGEHLGESVDASGDYDGDGRPDFVAGSPKWLSPANREEGRVIVISSARLAANTPPFELYTLTGGSAGIGVGLGWDFGAAVRGTDDLNNDGVDDLLVGMPRYPVVPFGADRGAARVYSGATGVRLVGVTGVNTEKLGDELLGSIGDLDGDGFAEFLVAGSLSSTPASGCGSVRCYRLFPCAPSTYCTAKVNSQGCTPAMGFNGSPSATSPAPFLVKCANVLNNKAGLLIYSHKPSATAFQGGLLCVGAPIKRVASQASGGSPTGVDCTGTFSFDFTPRIQGGADPTLVAGAEIFCQYWSRDPLSTGGSSLSNGVRSLINP